MLGDVFFATNFQTRPILFVTCNDVNINCGQHIKGTYLPFLRSIFPTISAIFISDRSLDMNSSVFLISAHDGSESDVIVGPHFQPEPNKHKVPVTVPSSK